MGNMVLNVNLRLSEEELAELRQAAIEQFQETNAGGRVSVSGVIAGIVHSYVANRRENRTREELERRNNAP